MKIYLAGYFNTRDRLRPIRDKINAMGHEILSSWLSERPSEEEDLNVLPEKHKFLRYAIRDLKEIKEASLIIVDTIDVTERGGREVEFGYAFARGLKIWIVGPTRNIFHFVADRRYETWPECLHALKDMWLERESNND